MSEAPSPVPELGVTDYASSLRFSCDLLGFEVLSERPEEGLAHIALAGAQIRLRHSDLDTSSWRLAALRIPLSDVAPQLARLRDDKWPVLDEPSEQWHMTSPTEEAGVRRFSVSDPDGYIVEFEMALGNRPVQP